MTTLTVLARPSSTSPRADARPEGGRTHHAPQLAAGNVVAPARGEQTGPQRVGDVGASAAGAMFIGAPAHRRARAPPGSLHRPAERRSGRPRCSEDMRAARSRRARRRRLRSGRRRRRRRRGGRRPSADPCGGAVAGRASLSLAVRGHPLQSRGYPPPPSCNCKNCQILRRAVVHGLIARRAESAAAALQPVQGPPTPCALGPTACTTNAA